jgi:hypothetical protein
MYKLGEFHRLQKDFYTFRHFLNTWQWLYTYMVWQTTFTALIGFSVSMFLDLNTVELDVTWSALRENTGSCRRVLNTPASHTRGPGFKSQPEDQLSWLRVSWFSSIPPGKYRDSTLNWTTTAFYIPCNSSFTHRFIRYYIVWATKKVSSLLWLESHCVQRKNKRFIFSPLSKS